MFMNAIQRLTWVYAVVFVLVGVAGFIPALTPNNELFGLFHVDATHNVIHLLSGIVAGVAAGMSMTAAQRYLQVFAVVYGLVAIIGFIQGNTVLGLMDVNSADNWLHVVFTLALAIPGYGMLVKDETTAIEA
jgi:hypothetical protein